MGIVEAEIFECSQRSKCDSCGNETTYSQLIMSLLVDVTDLNLKSRFHICLDCAELSQEQKIVEELMRLKNSKGDENGTNSTS